MNRRGIILLTIFFALFTLAAELAVDLYVCGPHDLCNGESPHDYRICLVSVAMILGFGLLAAGVVGQRDRERARKEEAFAQVRAREDQLRQMNERLQSDSQELRERNERLQELNRRLEANERKMLESEWRMDGILSSLRDTMVMVLDRAGVPKALWRDPLLDQKCGLDMSDWVGRPLKEVFPGEVAERLAAAVGQAIDKQDDAMIEQALSTPVGTFWYEISISPLHTDAGTVENAVCIIRDITNRRRMQEGIRQSEAKARAIADYACDWEMWIGMDGQPLWINPAVQRITGYSVEECMSMPDYPMSIIHPDDYSGAVKAFAAGGVNLDEASVGSNHEFRFFRKDGSEEWGSADWQLVYDENGLCLGCRTSVRVITERKHAESQLDNERRLFIGGPIVVFRWKALEGWPIEYVSPNVLAQLGYSCEDLVSDRISYSSIVHPSDLDRVSREVANFSAAGLSTFEQEYRLRAADGRYLWIFDHTLIIRDEQGKTTHFHGYIENNTARKESERTLRLTQFAMDRGADALLWAGVDGHLLYVNETACSMLGKVRDTLLSMSVFDVLPGHTPEGWMQLWNKVRTSGVVRFEIEKFSDGNRVFPVEILCNYLFYDEQEFNCVIIRDVSDRSHSRQALTDSEMRYRRLVESVTDYIYTVTIRAGKVVSTSHGPGCVAVTGYESEEYDRDAFLWVKMVPESDRPAVLEQLAKLLSGAATRPLEHRIIHKDGGIRWVKNTPVPRYDEKGMLIGYDGMISNISERRLAEEEILEYARKLEILNRIIVSASRSHELQTLMDDVLTRVLELMTFECGGIYLLDDSGNTAPMVAIKSLAGPEVQASFAEQSRNALASFFPEQQALADGQTLFADNYRDIAPEFVRKTGLMSLANVPLRAKDRVIGALKIATRVPHVFTQSEKDKLLSVCLQIGMVIDKVRSETALRESEEKYRTVTEQTLTGIFVIKSGRIVFANEGFTKIVKYPLPEIQSWGYEKFIGIVHPDDQPLMLEHLHRRLSGGFEAAMTYDCRFISKDGDVKWVFLHTKTVSYGGGPAIVGVFMDITDRKMAEQALATANRQLRSREEQMRSLNLHLMSANREKEVLMKEIHHRVKNNLQVISSLLKLQSNAIQDKRVIDLLRECQSRIKTMALVHEKMYQSRNMAEVNMGEYLRSLGDHLFNMFGVKTDRIKMKVVTDPVTLSLDKAIPCSLLVNELVSNALKYAFPEEQCGEISITLRGIVPNSIRIEVRDDGVGFPQDLDYKNTSSLGLQLVMTFVEQLGGGIELTRDHGTSFVITFQSEQPSLGAANARAP